MAFRTILWAGFFAAMCFAALGAPIWGIIGYVGHYSIGADRQWWSAPLRPLELRYSFLLAAFTAVGIVINWGKLRFGRSIFCRQEKLMLLFLGIVWLLVGFGPETVGYYTRPGMDHPSVKLAKIMFFAVMLTHVVTDLKNLDRLLWILVIGALILGLQAYSKPYGALVRGRLEGVGGPDFSDANRLGGYLAGMLFLIAVQFMRSGRWGKLLCLVAGVFATNAIILTRSRGVFLGVAAGALTVVLLAPKRYRAKILAGVFVAGLGGLYLSNPQFLHRTSTITESEGERDAAAQGRIEIWRGGAMMLAANPMGVGPGNFYQNIGLYAPEKAGRDAHSTFLRCAGELGIAGLAVFCAIVASALLTLRRVMRRAQDFPYEEGRHVLWVSYGAMTALVAVLTYGLTGTLVYTEYLWWLLAVPICLERVLINLKEDVMEPELGGAVVEAPELRHGALVA